jgi:hypothetical protein
VLSVLVHDSSIDLQAVSTVHLQCSVFDCVSTVLRADLLEHCAVLAHTQTPITTAWKAADNDICRHYILSIILCIYSKEHLWSKRLGEFSYSDMFPEVEWYSDDTC